MKLSINSLRTLNQLEQSAPELAPQGSDALAQIIGAQLGAIEETIAVGLRYQGARIVRVAACSKHPNADKLNVCFVDDGGKTPDVPRNEQGWVQVVCGAPNVREGLLTVWLAPGVTVPDSVGKDPFVLEARELRGIVSNGMLASPRELAIGDSHEGIIELTVADLPPVAQDTTNGQDSRLQPGTLFSDAFDTNDDVVFDIENKMFTHRPDCFGFLGLAREIAGIQGQAYHSPAWYRADAVITDPAATTLPLSVRNELPKEVVRFSALPMSNVSVAPSPIWLQLELAKLGLRPINNIVDCTNYYMMLTGQPLHAYDYDKVAKLCDGQGVTLVVRRPQPGEVITLINGKTIEPRSEAIMIATDKALLGVGGVMGGADTEVDDQTKNIILEAANFDMYSIRRTSMAHGLFTDAVTRFNKGQSPLQTVAVLAQITQAIRTMAQATVAGPLIDDNQLPSAIMERQSLHDPILVDASFINDRLGLELDAEAMATMLRNVECAVTLDGASLTVTAPFWRTDLEIAEDIVEEIGRLYGFDKLPLVLPARNLAPAPRDALVEIKTAIRTALSRFGANELLTYSFVHGKLLERVGQDAAQAYRLSNALSPDLQYYRLSVTPSLLDKIHANSKAGYGRMALFEIGKGHQKGQLDEPEYDDQSVAVPHETSTVAFVLASADKQRQDGAAFYQAKHYLRMLAEQLGVQLQFAPITEQPTHQAAQPFDYRRSAYVLLGEDCLPIGMVGEYTAATRKALKLPEYCAGFEITITPDLQRQDAGYQRLSRYPKAEQDICLKVATTVSYRQLYDCVQAALRGAAKPETVISVQPVDIYQRQDDDQYRQITLRVVVTDYNKTLRDAEVSALLEAAAMAAANDLQAERI